MAILFNYVLYIIDLYVTRWCWCYLFRPIICAKGIGKKGGELPSAFLREPNMYGYQRLEKKNTENFE